MKRKIILTLFVLFGIYYMMSQSGEIYQIGTSNNYVAGDYFDKVQRYKARQKSQNWCWAACVQMVLKNQGLFVDQCEIVKQGLGQKFCIDKPANCFTIEDAAGGWIINGKKIKSWVDDNLSPHELINDLAFKYPLIIGLNMPGSDIGHAYVLTAVYFKYDSSNRKIPYNVVLRDPWPSNPSRKVLSWSNFYNRINCVTHVTF